ncbi:Na+/H+ antiporter subunit G [Tahibacter harae]|uniref:Na+/H+ antiporter subunit G n=1 Tax=Tahibacter harae TaxID=2963937 RepID=A0ABT1QL05_9GAMM|nr:Na+/H+ antiporter subunit G [Tahibacter harae]MCQ4163102.1 Na+/H+ antiporter subunit G [Tahibacter harae]
MSAGAFWIEALAAGLLILSGLFVLVSAIGFARLPDFFGRMHPPALAYTLGSWCVGLAAALYYSFLEKRLALHPLLIPLLLSVTVPVTTVVLARVSLFRGRIAGGGDVPPTLAQRTAPESKPGGEES